MEADVTYFTGELRKVSDALTAPTTAYMFGGGTMAIRLLKTQTKDLDLVVRGSAASERLIEAFEKIGYARRRRLAKPYRAMHASAVLDNLQGFRIDLFTDVICRCLEFSAAMQKRSERFDLGTGRLEVRLAAPEDVFVLKAVTDRPRDVQDMARVARQGIDWDAIQEEMIRQRRTGGKFFMPIFIQSLEELDQDHKIRIPILSKMLEEVETDLDEIEALNEKAKREHAERAKK